MPRPSLVRVATFFALDMWSRICVALVTVLTLGFLYRAIPVARPTFGVGSLIITVVLAVALARVSPLRRRLTAGGRLLHPETPCHLSSASPLRI